MSDKPKKSRVVLQQGYNPQWSPGSAAENEYAYIVQELTNRIAPAVGTRVSAAEAEALMAEPECTVVVRT